MEKRYQVIKPKHGFYKGECLDTDIAPTIDTGVGCWHTLIGGSMEEIKCEQVSILSGGKWDKLHDISRRVYSADGLAPTVHTMGGGQQELKIIEPIAYDEQNGYIRQDGCVGTFTTDGSSPKHNNRVVEPILVGGIGEHDFGKQNRQGDRVYSADGVACALNAQPLGNAGGYSYLYQEPSYRIRKLTERECFRLMGVKSEDFEKIAKNQSMSSLYHLAGDSICCTCLMAIFGELFEIDYRNKINELVGELKQ